MTPEQCEPGIIVCCQGTYWAIDERGYNPWPGRDGSWWICVVNNNQCHPVVKKLSDLVPVPSHYLEGEWVLPQKDVEPHGVIGYIQEGSPELSCGWAYQIMGSVGNANSYESAKAFVEAAVKRSEASRVRVPKPQFWAMVEQIGELPTCVLAGESMAELVIPLGPYQHANGNTYEVIGFAINEPDLDTLVLYKGNGETWARRLSVFTELVTWPDGVTRPRFVAQTGSGQ